MQDRDAYWPLILAYCYFCVKQKRVRAINVGVAQDIFTFFFFVFVKIPIRTIMI